MHVHAVGDDDGRRRRQLGRRHGGAGHGRGYGDRIRKRARALSGTKKDGESAGRGLVARHAEHGRHADDVCYGIVTAPRSYARRHCASNGTGTVTLTGTAAAINTALAGASYTGNLNFHGTDTLSVTTTDGGGHSSGAHTAAITVADTAVISETVPPALSGNENTAIPLAGVSVVDTRTRRR